MCLSSRRCSHRESPRGRYTIRRALTTSWAAGLTLLAGCSASGHPDFAKFSPDGRRLVYQDARYDRAYVYDLGTRHRHEVPGHVACIDREVQRLVLLPRGIAGGYSAGRGPIPCTLLTISGDSLVLEQLPPLRVNLEFAQVLLEFAPNQTSLLATIYESRYADKPDSCRLLAIGGDTWLDTQIPEARRNTPPWRIASPGGIREGRYLYHPVYDTGIPLPGGELGMDVEREFRNDWLTYVLRSPDGSHLLRIIDGDDPWHRLTLTDLRTMKKEVILDKNDAALDVMKWCSKLILLPIAPFLPSF
jgi:hypothetical protein